MKTKKTSGRAMKPVSTDSTTLTIHLTATTMRRLRFVAGESDVSPEEWAASALGDAATVVASDIIQKSDDASESQRKLDAALNAPKGGAS